MNLYKNQQMKTLKKVTFSRLKFSIIIKKVLCCQKVANLKMADHYQKPSLQVYQFMTATFCANLGNHSYRGFKFVTLFLEHPVDAFAVYILSDLSVTQKNKQFTPIRTSWSFWILVIYPCGQTCRPLRSPSSIGSCQRPP